MSVIEAIRLALALEMDRDERMLLLGMDVGRLGGVFRATAGLHEKYGARRVVDTPLSEGAIIGASIGLAVGGLIPVAEIQFLGFTHQAFHQIGPQLARFRTRSRGRYPMPVTIRAPSGGGTRTPEFHADAVETQFTQSPGIKVYCPAFPQDALTLLRAAIRDPDPVLVVEPQRLYRKLRADVATDDPVTTGGGRLVRTGADVTLVSWGAAVHLCLEVADQLQEHRVAASVLDLRTLVPLDVETLIDAASRTGRVVVVHEGPLTGGFGAEIVAVTQNEAFRALAGPVRRVACYDAPYPAGTLEDHYLPSVRRVIDAVTDVLGFD
ncbi:alpha-ketoacid dehydrogenase subunit beta [Mycobacterium sp. C31M]